MAKVGRWSTTAANNNSTPPDGWPEGQAPSTVNDCAREMMAQIRTMLNDVSFIDLDHSPTQTTSTTFTIPGNVTTFYDIGRRVKAFDATTLYGTVISSSFTTNTGITLRLDSGLLTTSLTSVAVSVLNNTNHALPDKVFKQTNWIDNPQMDVWQRGNSFNFSGSLGASGLQMTADRWLFANNSGASLNLTRSERSANASNVPTLAQAGMVINSSLCISVSAVDAAIAASDYAVILHKIEGFSYRQFAQRPLTFGFWVNTNRTGTYCISMRNAGIDRCLVQEYSVSAASTWEEKTFSVPEPPSAGTWDYSSGTGLQIAITLAAGTAYQAGAGNWTAGSAIATSNQTNFLASAGHTIRFTGFYLTDGITKVPVQQRPISEEMQRCQRQLYVIDNTGNANAAVLGGGVCTGNSYADSVIVQMPTTMRSPPSLSVSSAAALFLFDGGVIYTINGLGSAIYATNSIWGAKISVTGAMNVGRVASLAVTAGGKCIFKAEL